MHLRSVPDDLSELAAGLSAHDHPEPDVPPFEGQQVDLYRIKLAGAGNLEAGDELVHLDDIVQFYLEGRVTRIGQLLDDKSGRLKRVTTVKVIDSVQLPLDGEAPGRG